MKWLRKRNSEEPKILDDLEISLDEAKAAVDKEKEDRQFVNRQVPEVRRVIRSLGEIQEENHLAAALRRALGG